MLDELSARQQAIRMRLAGEPVALICKVLKRSEAWVFKWWQRYVGGLDKARVGYARFNNRRR